MITRVVSVEQTDNWAKTGVMFRETLDAGSKFSNVLITGANGCRMQERNSTGGSAVSDSSVATDEQKAINAPYRVRLKRENLTTFRGYYSADGAVWTEMVWSPRTIDMAEDCYVGLCVTSHSNGVLCTAVFDNIIFGSGVGTDLKASMLGVNASLWTRIVFEVEDSNTPNSANANPRVGPVVINEIMYNPPSGNQNEEYIELHNITGVLVTLYRYDKSTPWKFTDGIDYTFSSGPPVTIQAYGYVMVVKDIVAFTAKYGGMPPGVQVLDGFGGMLSNAGERLQIAMPGDIDEIGTRQYIRIDRVTYSDGFHPEDCPGGVDLWPAAADGLGKSLSRKVSADYGNDVDNWQAATPSPGVVNP